MNESTPPRPSFAGPLFFSFIAILLTAGLAVLPLWVGKPDQDGLQDIVKFIGRFHPVVLHLPIGMLAWVLLLETGNLFSRKPGRPSSRMPMMFTALSALIAALLGFALYHSTPDYDAELVERHLYGGLFFACATVATFAFKSWVDALGIHQSRRRVVDPWQGLSDRSRAGPAAQTARSAGQAGGETRCGSRRHRRAHRLPGNHRADPRTEMLLLPQRG
jgi:uncharacterized membrane protein